MKNFLLHLFVPQESNNHRSKILHHNILLSIIIFLLTLQFFVPIVKASYPSVLGTSIDISSQQLLLLTNQKRQENGQGPLQLNQDLAKAASLKASDMFTKNYWAHNAPDGTTPWVFFRNAGYDYVYAGENLARGFTKADEIINAWMASPSHRDNMLSGNYTEVGFAIVEGKLLGEQTVLVVEMFGNKSGVVSPKKETTQKMEFNSQKPVSADVLAKPISASLIKNQPLIDTRMTFWTISIIIISLFISILLLDMIIIQKKKIIRIVGHNPDHAIFFGSIMVLLFIISKGVIL